MKQIQIENKTDRTRNKIHQSQNLRLDAVEMVVTILIPRWTSSKTARRRGMNWKREILSVLFCLSKNDLWIQCRLINIPQSFVFGTCNSTWFKSFDRELKRNKKSTRNTFAWFKFRHVGKGQKTHSFQIKIMNVCRLLPLLLQISFNIHLSIEDSSNWIGLIPLIVSNLNKLTHNESVYLFSNAIETDKSTISNEPNEKRKTINGFH